MNPILRKMTAGVFAFGLVATMLSTATPVAAATGTLDFTLNTTTPATGEAVTITPTGSYTLSTSPSDSASCSYHLMIHQVHIAGQINMDQEVRAASASVGGKCPSWTFTLPNLSQMVFTGGLPTTVSVFISASEGGDEPAPQLGENAHLRAVGW